MKWATCNYGNVNDGPCASLAGTVQQIHDQITLILAGNVDGDNLDPELFGAGIRFGGPIPAPPLPAPRPPPKIIVTLSDEKTRCWIQKKGPEAARDGVRPGLELVVDTDDIVHGKVCIVSRGDLAKQIGSLIPEDPRTVANPKMSFVANYGKVRLGTTGAFDWELARNGTVTLDDNGSRIKSGRSALYLGGDDLSVERSAAGKMVLSDPSGGVTKPGLQFGGSTNSFPMIARQGASSSGLELRLADDSGQADLDANALYIVSRSVRFNSTGNGLLLLRDSPATSFGRVMLGGTTPSFPAIKRNGAIVESKLADDSAYTDHAVSDLLGYGAATGFRTKIDFGTPTADRTLTAPNRDLTLVGRAAALTSGQLVKADVNGDIVDVGNAAAARTLIGAGTIATQDASSVALTGGTIDAVSIRDFRKGYVTFTASAAGNNNVNSTTATAFVNAFALGTTDNYDVTLPDATTCGGRVINVKIIEPGSGSATVTVKSAGGGLDQVAAATGVPMDATAFSKVAYQSDGTNWWSV